MLIIGVAPAWCVARRRQRGAGGIGVRGSVHRHLRVAAMLRRVRSVLSHPLVAERSNASRGSLGATVEEDEEEDEQNDDQHQQHGGNDAEARQERTWR